MAGWEDDDETVLKADKIVCDCWEIVKHRTQTLSRLYKIGRLKDSNIHADLIDIIIGRKPGRESDEEFNYFNSVGLSYIDIALAYDMFKKAEDKAVVLPFQEESIFAAVSH